MFNIIRPRMWFCTRLWLWLGLVTVLGFNGAINAVEVPNALKDWTGWVLHGQESLACTPMQGASDDERVRRDCIWPQSLVIDVDATGARFEWPIEAQIRTAVTLPGNAKHWPLEVRNQTQSLAVVNQSEHPVVWLEPGLHRLSGRLVWEEMPESIEVPTRAALIRLSVNGKPVFPLQREDNSLWLGQGKTEAIETDHVSVRVFRKWLDLQPAQLHTEVHLDIAGRGREETIGMALPEGFKPMSIESDLPAILGRDGVLKIQARPGSYSVRINARALAPMPTLALRTPTHAWPAQEVWSFEAVPNLRVVEANSANSIDPAQADVPPDWQELPAWLLDAEHGLSFQARARGVAASDENRLRLHRDMRLAFDGSRFRSSESVSGQLVRDWRLDMATPFDLASASIDEEPLLVTRGKIKNTEGVEVRSREIELQANTELSAASMRIPVTGWQQRFDQVTTQLHLGPGFRLWGTIGADQATGAWIGQWRLLDLFALALGGLLAFWIRGPRLAALVVATIGLSFHESLAPVVTLILSLLLLLAARALPDSKFKLATQWIRNLFLFALVVFLLPFAYQHLRSALFLQLEEPNHLGARYAMESAAPASVMANQLPKVAPERPMAQAESNVEVEAAAAVEEFVQSDASRNDEPSKLQMEQIEVVGSRIKQSDIYNLNRYQANAMVQAGNAMPEWQWHSYELTWNGPVKPDQTVRLLIAPPWMMRLFRVAIVALYAVLLWKLFEIVFASSPLQKLRATGFDFGKSRTAVSQVFSGIGLTILALSTASWSSASRAETLPNSDLLDTLGERLQEAPRCSPSCGDLAKAQIFADGNRLQLSFELHAAETVALPIPLDLERSQIEQVQLDTRSDVALLNHDGSTWVAIPRGVHRLLVVAQLADVDKLSLQFRIKPRDIQFTGNGWTSQGINQRQLLGDTLELVRVRGLNNGTNNAANGSADNQDFEPFVSVTRQLIFGMEWHVETTVERIAPLHSGFAITLPLLEGEQVLTSGMKVEQAQITVSMPAGQDSVRWESKLDFKTALRLQASAWTQHHEEWILLASPMWSIEYNGIPVLYPDDDDDDDWTHRFAPLPGETLQIKVSRPETSQGATMAIDRVQLNTSIGQRARQHDLQFDLRSTQGGRHSIQLPKDAVVTRFSVDDNEINLRPENGLLRFPVKPGNQSVQINWRDDTTLGLTARTPMLDLKSDSANIELNLQLPDNRWLIGLSGPRMGPALSYYGEVVLMLLIAFGLSRWRHSPLRFYEWALLGLGFSAMFWIGYVIVALFLLAFAWRGQAQLNDWRRLSFNLMQVSLLALAAAACIALLSALLWFGLFRSPDMGLIDPTYQSSAANLHWLIDQSNGQVTSASAFTLPMWMFRGLMLAWAVWLAIALSKWIRGFLLAWQHQGWWRVKPKTITPPAPPVRDANDLVNETENVAAENAATSKDAPASSNLNDTAATQDAAPSVRPKDHT